MPMLTLRPDAATTVMATGDAATVAAAATMAATGRMLPPLSVA
jgi:hypothetical protein